MRKKQTQAEINSIEASKKQLSHPCQVIRKCMTVSQSVKGGEQSCIAFENEQSVVVIEEIV